MKIPSSMSANKWYTEEVIGGPNNRGCVVEMEVDRSIDLDLFEIPMVKDAYSSAFVHGREFYDYAKEHRTIRGYDGVVHADYIFWDFDSEVEVEKARVDVIELLTRLEDIGIDVDESCRIFFSGEQ